VPLRRRSLHRNGQPQGVLCCHCLSCRRHSGAQVSVFVAVERDAYAVTKGETTKLRSSPGTTRGFCRTCGSTLTCENVQLPTETHFHVGAFGDARRFEPPKHFFRGEHRYRNVGRRPAMNFVRSTLRLEQEVKSTEVTWKNLGVRAGDIEWERDSYNVT
jgi:hypothetical protein